MNLDYLCMGCMREKKEWTPVCPFCGYDGVNTANKENQLPTWTLLNNSYLIGKSLGEGGFGTTYLSFDINLHKKMVIKEFFLDGYAYRVPGDLNVYTYQDQRGDMFVKQKNKFVEEARILAQIDEQPGIVKVISYFEANRTAYIAMEFIEGQSLKNYVAANGGRLAPDYAIDLLKPVIAALAAVHQKGVVHRDISPDNIMLDRSGRLKLIDFGAAKDRSGNLSADKVFKPAYSPPEQMLVDGIIGAYSDVYALCASIYRIITGLRVPPATERLKQDTLVSPSAMGIAINPIYESAILRGLTLDASKRIKNATDLYYFLYVYSNETGASDNGIKKKIEESSTEVIMDKMRRQSRARNNKIMAAIAISVIIVLGCMIIAFNHFFKGEDEYKDKTTTSDVTEDRDGAGHDINNDVHLQDEGDNAGNYEGDDAAGVTTLQEELYRFIEEGNQNPKMEIDREYEKVVSDLVNKAAGNKVKDKYEAVDNINSIIYSSNISSYVGAGYQAIVFTGNTSVKTVYDYFNQEIAKLNEQYKKDNPGSQDLNMADLHNCSAVGVAVVADDAGIYYWMVMYRY